MLFNATSSIKEQPALVLACKEGAVGAMQAAAAVAHAHGKEGLDGLSLAYSAMVNLAEGCPEGCEAFVRSSPSVEQLLSLCGSSAPSWASAEVKNKAAELLLALCAGETSRKKLLAVGAQRTLEALASAGWSNEVNSARAKQALMELAA